MSKVFVGTRDDAVHLLLKVTIASLTDCRIYVDGLIALGIWTPTEPKSVEEETVEALSAKGYIFARELFADLKAAGFTVTKAVTP